MVFKSTVGSLPFSPPSNVPIHRFILDDEHGRCPAAKSSNIYICNATGKAYSVSDVHQRVEELAAGLGQHLSWSPSRGSSWDKVISIFSLNSIDTIPAMWAVHRLNGIASPIHAISSASEAAVQARQVGAKALVTCRALLPAAIIAAEKAGVPLENVFLLDVAGDTADPSANTLNGRPFQSINSLAESGRARQPLEPLTWSENQGTDQVAYVCFSSGTSGLPKGVKITHRNVISNIMQQALIERKQRGPDETKTVLGLLPISHIYALVVVTHATAYRGDGVVILPRYELESMLGAISKYRISMLYMVPPILLDCVRHETIVQKYDLSCATHLMTGAASFSEATRSAIKRILPNGVVRQGYGLTETAAVVSSTPKDEIFHGSSGVLLPEVEVKIVAEDGSECTGYDQPGEIWVRSPSVTLKGYLNNEQASQETFVDGWMVTGDKGLFRKNPATGSEHIFIIDRIKELIKVKGMQVAPAELESHILQHPDAVDAAVIAVEDERSGELPKAFVVKRTGSALSEEELARQIHASFEQHKSRYKWLRGGIEFRTDIPKSNSGKILRRLLREEAARKHAPAAKL